MENIFGEIKFNIIIAIKNVKKSYFTYISRGNDVYSYIKCVINVWSFTTTIMSVWRNCI